MGYNDYKHNSIEVFGEMAKNRLITGFLSINVVHTDNEMDSEGDWKKEWAKNGEVQQGQPGGRRPTHHCSGHAVANPEDINKRIADYSCHVFYVVAGCTWNDARVPGWQDHYTNPTGDPEVGYWDGNSDEMNGEPNTNRAHPDHCNCQSFVRAYPLGLINPDTGTLVNHQTFTVDGMHGIIRSKLGNAKNFGEPKVEDGNNISFADLWQWKQVAAQFGAHNGLGSPYKQPAGTRLNYDKLNEEYIHDYGYELPNYSETPQGVTNPHVGPECGFPDLAFNRVNPRSLGNSTGLLPNYGNGYISPAYTHPTAEEDGTIDWNDDDQRLPHQGWDDTTTGSNTSEEVNQNKLDDMDLITDIDKSFKNPVRGITIEGWHDFEYRDGYSGSPEDTGYGQWYYDGENWTPPAGGFAVTRHSPFALRVSVELNSDGWERIEHPGTGGDMGPGVLGPNERKKIGVSDAEADNPYEETYGLGNRTVSFNVSFNPLGETNSIIFKNSPPGGLEDDGNPA